MVALSIKNKLDQIRDYLFGGGFPDPLTNSEQLSYLFYFNLMEYVDKNNLILDKKNKSIFDGYWKIRNPLNYINGNKNISKKNFKWSSWRVMTGPELVSFVRDEVFPFYEEISSKGATNFMIEARLSIDEPVVLSQVIFKIDELNLNNLDPDTKGDLFEYVLKQVKQAGELGQFRTPRHIIDFMVELINPKLSETIYDPAAGTAGFLVSSYNHIRTKHSSSAGKSAADVDGRKVVRGIGDKLSRKEFRILQSGTFFGNDVDKRMIRLASMNLSLRDLTKVKILKRNPLTKIIDKEYKIKNSLPLKGYDVILANPPFSGTIDSNRIIDDVKVLNSTATETLFVKYIIENLKINGRAAVVVPDGIIHNVSNADVELRRQLVENNNLISVISLPTGVFQPYANNKTSILFFSKRGVTSDVLFIDIKNDGFKLDANHSTPIKENDLPAAIKLFLKRDTIIKKWKKEKLDNKIGQIYYFASKKEIIKNNYSLQSKIYSPKKSEERITLGTSDVFEKLEELEIEIFKEIKDLKKIL